MPLSPTIIQLVGGAIRLRNGSYASGDTQVDYTHVPGDDYVFANGVTLGSFSSPLPFP